MADQVSGAAFVLAVGCACLVHGSNTVLRVARSGDVLVPIQTR